MRAKRNGLADDVYAVDIIDFFGVQPGIPILHIFSVEKAKEFYIDFLGLGIDPASTVSPPGTPESCKSANPTPPTIPAREGSHKMPILAISATFPAGSRSPIQGRRLGESVNVGRPFL